MFFVQLSSGLWVQLAANNAVKNNNNKNNQNNSKKFAFIIFLFQNYKHLLINFFPQNFVLSNLFREQGLVIHGGRRRIQ